MKFVPKCLQGLDIHLLDIMGNHDRFAGLAHAKTFDGLDQNDGGFALILHGC